MQNVKIRTTMWQKPVGYCSPVRNHNSGRKLAMDTRTNYDIQHKTAPSCCGN